ncbi:MAG: hypothetical protein PUK03_05935, partial [Bacteroidales bacterium]|nr:hypothetical protein [Bacteroidales bacterium]
PKSIIAKYSHKTYRDGKLFPILTNQKTNAYLKEIADLCGVKKNLTFHMAKHSKIHKWLYFSELRQWKRKVGNNKETSDVLYSSLFCIFKESLLNTTKVILSVEKDETFSVFLF